MQSRCKCNVINRTACCMDKTLFKMHVKNASESLLWKYFLLLYLFLYMHIPGSREKG